LDDKRILGKYWFGGRENEHEVVDQKQTFERLDFAFDEVEEEAFVELDVVVSDAELALLLVFLNHGNGAQCYEKHFGKKLDKSLGKIPKKMKITIDKVLVIFNVGTVVSYGIKSQNNEFLQRPFLN
jgi:hypothetical protein